MRDVWTIAKFTAREMLKKRSFIISTLVILLVIVIAFNIPNIMNSFKSDNTDTNNSNKVLVIDQEDLYMGTITSLNEVEKLGYNFEVTKEDKSMDELKEKIEKGDYKFVIKVTKQNDNVKVEYITDSLGFTGMPMIDSTVFTELYQGVKLSQSGLTLEQIQDISKPIEFEITQTGNMGSGGTIFISMMLCIILFFAIYYCAYQVATSITIEKTSKIMDTLITSTPPKAIVLGKTLGMGIVGLLEVLAIVIVTVISYKVFLPAGILDGLIDASVLTPQFIIISIVFFILGYTLYAFIYAFTGSLVSKPEEIQSVSGLVGFVAIIGFYLAYFSMMNPTSGINKLAQLLPFSSPFSVPARFMAGAVSTTDLILSIVILVVSILIFAFISIKIYSAAILNYGTKVSIKEIRRMLKQKNDVD